MLGNGIADYVRGTIVLKVHWAFLEEKEEGGRAGTKRQGIV
jgi:hypothetical protein